MRSYRIVREKFARDISGEGAKLYGGRWNSIGIPCIYTSTNISLCLCEYLVNLPTYLLPSDLQLVIFELADSNVINIDNSSLPKGWDGIPVSTVSQNFGDEKLNSTEVFAFSIPSVIISQERNIILNPRSTDFSTKIKIISVDEFKLDSRFEK